MGEIEPRAASTAPLGIVGLGPSANRSVKRSRFMAEAAEYARLAADYYDHRESNIRESLEAVGCPPNLRQDARRELKRIIERGASPVRLQRHQDYVATPSAAPVGHPCRYCGAPSSHMDHVWPRARGGDDHPNNLVPACTSCNTSKGSQSWLTERCPNCEGYRDPGDVETSTGRAFYACRCGRSWSTTWDLQHGVNWRQARASGW